MKSKMLSSVVILMLLLGFALAGCQPATSAPAQTPAPVQTSAPAAASPEKTEAATQSPAPAAATPLPEAELVYYFPMSAQADQDLVYGRMNDCIKPKINATVDFKPVDWGSWGQKINVVVASGDPWDIAFSAIWTSGGIYTDLAAKGALLPLDDLLANDAPKTFAAIPSKYWDCTKINGHIYGVINYQLEFVQWAYYFNVNLVNKYSLTDAVKAIKTTEDLEPILATIRDNESDVYPLARGELLQTVMEAKNGFFEFAAPFGVNMNDPEFKVVDVLNTDDALQLLQMKHAWYENGIFRKGEVTISDWTNTFTSGKVFCYAGNWTPGCEASVSARWGYPFMTVKVTDAICDPTGPIQTLNVINANSKNPDRAMMFLELLNSDKDLYNLMCFGIEGQHYTVLTDGKIQVSKDSKYNPNCAWEFGNQFNALVMEGQDSDVWQQTIDANNSAIANPLSGFVADLTPVQNEYAACTAASSPYATALSYGIGDPTQLMTEYNQKMKEAGADIVMAELQKQIDAFMAQKKTS